jgi:hypothetical protein
MARFADPDWKHNEFEIIMKHWDGIIPFCYSVELKVLVLFALALDVFP